MRADGRRDPETYKVIGAAMEVHRELGSGILEEVYHEALKIEFREKGIPFAHEVELRITYKGEPLRKTYRADFVCFDNIVVELKALQRISGKEKSQIINYLKATGLERGLLLNFGSESLQYSRFVNSLQKTSEES
jgi:GxxExxY protein